MASHWIYVRVLAVLLVFTAGCQMLEPEPTPSPAETAAVQAEVESAVGAYALAATVWELAILGPPEESLPALTDTRATVTYFWDRYAGYDGCNNWFLGVYSATAEGELRMQTPTQTRKCVRAARTIRTIGNLCGGSAQRDRISH